MDIKQIIRIIFLLSLSSISLVSFGQNVQIINAELSKDATTESITLNDDTAIDNTDVFDDELIVKRLPANQSGYLEFVVNQFMTSEVEVKLQVENDPTKNYSFKFDNGGLFIQLINQSTYSNGDVFRIERCGSEINFFINGQLLTLNSGPEFLDFGLALVLKVEVTTANNGANLRIEFPHLLPHCVPDSQVPDNKDNFAAVKKYMDASFVRVDDQKLKFWYKERYAIANGENGAVGYKIYDWRKEPNQIVQGSLVNCYGTNWHQIELDPVTENTHLTLELIGPNKGETYYLRFEQLCDPCAQ